MTILMQSSYFQLWSDHFTRNQSTKQGYIYVLKKFDAFLSQEGFEGKLNFDEFHASREHPGRYLPIQRKVIDRFLLTLKQNQHYSDSRLAATITILKKFFEFLYDTDLIQHNPMAYYPRPKCEHPVQNTALSINECIALLKAALQKDPFYRQQFVFIWFLLITGLRISEVRFLRRKRLNLEKRIVQVFDAQKTEKRPVAISSDLAVELKRYTQHSNYVMYANKGDEYLFHQQGKMMTAHQFKLILSDLSKDAGIIRHIRPHDLRRTAGYLMQTGGMNLVDIQHQLRHKQIGTTLRYVPPLNKLAEILEES